MSTARKPSISALLVAAALVGACGDEPPAVADAPSLLRFELAEGAEWPADRVALRIDVPRDFDSAWRVQAPERELVELTDGASQRGLHMWGAGEHTLAIPGAYDPATFDAVVLHVASPGPLVATVRLGKPGASTAGTARGPVWNHDRTRAVFDMRSAAGAGAILDTLGLSVEGGPADWTLLGLELLERPVESWLPRAGEGGALIRAGGEARHGVGLSSRVPLVAERVVPRAGRLTFSYAWPEGTDGRAELVVRVSVDGTERRVARHALSGSGWQDTALDLSEWAGRRARFGFELEAAGAAPRVCALAEARVFESIGYAPLVLLITSDTHRADHVGAARLGVDVLTPTLDALAEEGILFEDCYSSSNVTVASHSALMTGVHPRDTGVTDNDRALAEVAVTLAERFKAAGFATFAAVSVRHLAPEMGGLAQGFDRYFWPPEKEHPADVAVGKMVAWLPAAERLPLFAWLHVFDAHTPYAPPAPYDALYYPEGKDAFDPSLPKRSFPVPPQRGVGNLRDINWLVAQYGGEVTYLDARLADILDVPRVRTGVVAMTADHGESLYQHDIYWRHFGLYPDTVHVPLILKFPGGPRGVRSSRRVRQMDLGHTLLALAGLENRDFPGRMLPLDGVRDEPEGPDNAATGDTPRFALGARGREASIAAGGWFLNLNLVPFSRNRSEEWGVFERHQVELYDLESDPGCERNLATVEVERAKRLRARLIEWLCAAVDTGWSEHGFDSVETRRVLAQLGYASGGPAASQSDLIDPECDCERCAPFR